MTCSAQCTDDRPARIECSPTAVSRARPAAPRISLVLLAHNQQTVVRAAAESCLAQRGEPLEIVFSDDASTDGTFAQLQAAAAGYAGPHQVRVRRNRQNLGIGAHYNQLIAETSGALLVTAAGDDVSAPDRVQRLAQAWDASGQKADLISSHYIRMGLDGTTLGASRNDDLGSLTLASWLARSPFSLGATHAFTRRMMERFGPFVEGVWLEDKVMVLRAVLGGGGITVNAPLVRYRLGGSSHFPRAPTAEQLVRWHRARNVRCLAEVAQMVQDAEVAGRAPEVRGRLARTLEREAYVRELLDATGAVARWRALLAARRVPLAWRCRKLMAVSMPAQAAACRRLVARLPWRSARRAVRAVAASSGSVP